MPDLKLAGPIWSIWMALAGYLILLVSSALLSAYQVALLSVRRSRLTQLAEAGNEAARRAERLVDQPETFMIASRIALALIWGGGAALAGALALLLAISTHARAQASGRAIDLHHILAALPLAVAGASLGSLI